MLPAEGSSADLGKPDIQQGKSAGRTVCFARFMMRAVVPAHAAVSASKRAHLLTRDFQDLRAVIITTNQGTRSAIPHQVEDLSCRTGYSRTRGQAKLFPGTGRRRTGRGIARAFENLRELRLLLVSRSRRNKRLLHGL